MARRRTIKVDPCIRRAFEHEFRELLDLSPGVSPPARVRKNLMNYAHWLARQRCTEARVTGERAYFGSPTRRR